MAQVIYALQFKGQAQPVEGTEGLLRAATESPSSIVRTEIGDNGVTGSVEQTAGGGTRFESEVRFTAEGVFQETGSIQFGDASSIRFSTVGEGHLGPSAEEGVQHGCVCWRVDSGSGQLEGATGLITSNFTVDSSGTVTDNHFGVFWTS